MDIRSLSKKYDVRALDIDDLDTIYYMSCKNEIYYKYHPPFVTKESIAEDILLVQFLHYGYKQNENALRKITDCGTANLLRCPAFFFVLSCSGLLILSQFHAILIINERSF